MNKDTHFSKDYLNKLEKQSKKLAKLPWKILKKCKDIRIKLKGGESGFIYSYKSNPWLNECTKNNILLDTIHYKKLLRYGKRCLKYTHYWKRIKSLFEQEKELREKHGDLLLFKIDFLNTNIDVCYNDFKALIKEMTNSKRGCGCINDLICGWNYCIELTDYDYNGNYLGYYLWHMHLFVYMKVDLIKRHDTYEKQLLEHDNMILAVTSWIQGIFKGRDKFKVMRDIRLNVAGRYEDLELTIRKLYTNSEIKERNADRYYLCYTSKVSDDTARYLKEHPNVRLFGLSTFT